MVSCPTLSPKSHHRWVFLDIKGQCTFQGWWKWELMLGEEPAESPIDVLKIKDTKWVDQAPSSQLPLLHIDALWESGGHTCMHVHMCTGMAQRLLLLFRDVHSPHPHPVAQQACTLSFLAVTLGLLKTSVQTAWQRLSTIGYVGNLNRGFLCQLNILWTFDSSLSCVYAEFPFIWAPITLSNSSLCCRAARAFSVGLPWGPSLSPTYRESSVVSIDLQIFYINVCQIAVKCFHTAPWVDQVWAVRMREL